MSMYLSEETIPFYLQGRGAKLARIKKYVADPEEIAEQIEGGKAKVRDAIGKACTDAAEQLMGDRKRKAAWIEENADELAEVTAIGGKDEAWKAYCYGMGDELAYAIEPDVLDVLEDPDGEGDGDDGDEGDDEDDDKKPS